MQHASRDDEIEALVQLADALDRQLSRFEIREVVLLLERLSMIETGGANIDGDNACSRMTEGKLCRLPRSTSGNENIKIGAIFLVGPEQMILGAMDVFVLP